MAYIDLVIKISEKVYTALTHTEFDATLVVDEMRKSIANGVPLVQCKDCKWFAEFTHNGEPTGHGSCNNPQNGWGRCPQADWFCADGERRE